MRVITTVSAMGAERARLSDSVGLVPTMGYLHEGHISLVRRARAENESVVVSIFVNPAQFGPNEDFERYPRDAERDLSLLRAEGVDAVFAPAVEEMYPPGFDQWVEVSGPLVSRLEGEARPGHFRGVTTVVARLFRVIRPQRAYFGQKDAQQLRVIRAMVRQESLPVQVVPGPTVREPDGLAMSSRNVYLTPEQRASALALSRALRLARRLVQHEGVRDAGELRRRVRNCIGAEPLVELEYVCVSDEVTLEELSLIDRPALVLLAARVGSTRLIDNTLIAPPGVPVPKGLREIAGDLGGDGV